MFKMFKSNRVLELELRNMNLNNKLIEIKRNISEYSVVGGAIREKINFNREIELVLQENTRLRKELLTLKQVENNEQI